MKFYQKYKKIFAIVFGIFMLAGFSYLGYSYYKVPVKIVDSPVLKNYEWVDYKDNQSNVSFKYPKTLLMEYMHVFDWPPKIFVGDDIFSCTQAGSEITPAGKTTLETINGRTYCVTTEKQGAAGSIYTQYAYAAQKNAKKVIATFSIRATQCGNYEEPKRTECEQERAAFEINSVVDQIFETIQFLPVISAPHSGITGSVLLGPICPVMRNPPDPQCADKPFAVRLVVTPEGKSNIIKEFTSDTSGKFKVSLSPGFYEIHQAPIRRMLPRCASRNLVEVTRDTYTQTIVYCDTGIR